MKGVGASALPPAVATRRVPLAAPAGTPAAAIERIRAAATQALAQPAVVERLRDLGVKARASQPAEQARLLADEIQHWGRVVRAAKIEPE